MNKIDKLNGIHYLTCTACMSVWADGLSWANTNPNLITKNPNNADNIIILSCQVTDLAILNDFMVAESLRDKYPDKKIFISGCLAQRTDISFPDKIERLEQMRCNYQHINDKTLVNFEKPFWVKDFKENDVELKQGNLFRNKYPLRIGKGCMFNCSFCTINITRGDYEKYEINEDIIDEFLKFDDVILIADSPTIQQVKDWCGLAIKTNKPISIRNVEPLVGVRCKDILLDAAKLGVLEIFHCPIQNNNPDILKDMHRSVGATLEIIEISKELKNLGVVIATNIIVDYKDYPNDFKYIYDTYDYVSWNPFWDGKWDREKAIYRYEKYINQNYKP